jgi:hypothetical protein
MLTHSLKSGSSDEPSIDDLIVLKRYPKTKNPGITNRDKIVNIPRIRILLKLVSGYCNESDVICPASIFFT